MTVIENLDVVLSAKTSKLDSGLRDAGKMASNFGNHVSGAANKLAGFEPSLPVVGKLSGLIGSLGPGGLAAAASIGGITVAIGALSAAIGFISAGVAKQLPEIDKLGKAADAIGIATDQLAGIRLAAGEGSGMAAEQVDKAITGMTKRISEAAQGTGKAANALKEMGINAQELTKLTPDRQFHALAEEIKQAGNYQDQLRIASRLFGEDGARLVSTMRGGTEALSATYDYAVKFGLALTDAQVNGVEGLNDKVARLNQLMDGFFNVLAAELAPAISLIADDLLEWADSGGSFADALAGAGGNAALLYGTLKDVFEVTKATWDLATNPVAFLADGSWEDFQNLANGTSAKKAFADYLQLVADASVPRVNLDAAQQPAIDEAAKAAEELNKRFADPSDQLSETLAKLDELKASGLIDDRTAILAAQDAVDKFVSSVKEFDAEMLKGELRQAFEDGSIGTALIDQLLAVEPAKAAPDTAENTSAPRDAPSFATAAINSVAAYKSLVSNERGGGEQLAEAKRQTGALTQIHTVLNQQLGALQNIPGAEGV